MYVNITSKQLLFYFDVTMISYLWHFKRLVKRNISYRLKRNSFLVENAFRLCSNWSKMQVVYVSTSQKKFSITF